MHCDCMIGKGSKVFPVRYRYVQKEGSVYFMHTGQNTIWCENVNYAWQTSVQDFQVGPKCSYL